jgi:hypothetical protein
MFGQMQVTRMFQPSKLETADEAVAKLLDLRGVTLDFSLVLVPYGPGGFCRPC